MANTKEYSIKINGLTESINAVDSLNKQLDKLEQRMKTINATKTSSGGGSSSSRANTALSEEERVQKEINKLKEQGAQLDAKMVAAQDEVYKRVDATKQLYKETIADQKAIAAQERLTANAYSNTMVGMKQQLADIKAVIQTTDLSDTDGIKKMTEQANELTNKLKEMEEAYGQFGRNVGNYQSALNGLDKYKIEVGGVTREFDNAKQAAKTLSNELLNMPKGAEGAEALHEALLKVRSDIADLNKSSSVMDNLLDTMESFTAIANVGQGIRGLFGVDDAEMQKSIKNLVALQNMLKGIETINKQMKTGEGIGGWLKPFNTQIDAAITKLVSLQTTMKATTVASKTMVVGLKAATLALKAFKAALSLGISIAIDLVLEKVLDLIEKFKEGDKELEKHQKFIEETQGAYVKASVKIDQYKQKVKDFNGTKKEEKKLVNELNSELGKEVGQYKSLTQWQKRLEEIGDAYAQVMLKEAEAQAILNEYTSAYIDLMKLKAANEAGENDAWYRTKAGDMEHRQELENKQQEKMNKLLDEYNNKMKEANSLKKQYKLFDYSDQIEKGGKNSAETVKKVEEDIAKARIDAMKNGFAKTMAELDLERNKRIEEAKKTGYKVNEQIALANKIYNQKVLEATIAHHQKLIAEQKTFNEEWERLNQSSYSRNVETSRLTNTYNFNKKKNEYINNPVDEVGNQLNTDEWVNQFTYNYNNIIKYNQKLVESYKRLSEEVRLAENAIEGINSGEISGDVDVWEEKLDEYTRKLEQFISKYPGIVGAAEDAVTTDIDTAYAVRSMARQAYYENILKYTKEYADKELKIEKDKLSTEQYDLEQAEKKRHELMASSIFDKDKSNDAIGARVKQLYEGYAKIFNSGDLGGMTTNQIGTYFSKYREEMDKWLDDLEEKAKKGEVAWEEYIEITNSKLLKSYIQLRADSGDNLQELNNGFVKYMDNLRHEFQEHENAMLSIQNNANQKKKDAEEQKKKEERAANAEYYQSMESELEEVLQSINNLIETSQQRNSLGLINMNATKKNLDNLKEATKSVFDDIDRMKKELLDKLKSGDIEFADFDPIYEQLRALELQLIDTANNIKRKTSEIFTEFMGEIAQYAQALGSGLSNMLQAFADYADQQHENTIKELEDQIDKQKELQQKQEELANEHKNKLNEIEDELATARGDRRQRLIDELNAEMAAQRQALAEQKKAEKEQKKLEDRKLKEEHKRKEDQKKMAMTQAVINGATAFMNALAQQPIWLGIALAAMTAVMTAAQIATISSAKYADGGVIDGPSHARGGVKVLGGQAEVEGQEFITNKRTTSQNVDLLYYINSKKKKLDLSDFIEFYASGKTTKNISPTRRVFADGGQIPTLRGDIDINSRLLTAFEDYSNRPVQVAVVDINERQAAVRNVQVMAGLEN